MKKIPLFIVLVFGSYVSAQTINIPDANFKAKLVNASAAILTARDEDGNLIRIDTNFNNEIEYSEALTVYELYLSNSNISSLEGIQNFINLRTLVCQYNNLTELPVSNLTQLRNLSLESNQLSSVAEIENLVQLNYLGVSDNPLLTLPLQNLSNLGNLYCSETLLSEINLCGSGVIILWCESNPNLETLLLKNNVITPAMFARSSYENETSLVPPPLFFFMFSNCPSLTSVCYDEGEYPAVVAALDTINSITLSTLCSSCPTSSLVELKLNVQGFYDTTTNRMKSVNNNQLNTNDYSKVTDVSVELRDATGTLIATTTTDLKTDGTATCVFPDQPTGSFYIGVKTENSIQTWSATPELIGSTPLQYDFTTAANKAFGDNLTELTPGVFGLFSGDINNDGNVDNSDYAAWEMDSNNFSFGPFSTDLNGDGNVDNSDYTVWETNSNVFIYAISPF